MARLVLAEMLKKKRVSKRQFAKRLGVDYKNVWRLFRPEADPRLSALVKYAQALGCKVRDLIRD
jgi:transcriptional regulator with XRE-family HTH domain